MEQNKEKWTGQDVDRTGNETGFCFILNDAFVDQG